MLRLETFGGLVAVDAGNGDVRLPRGRLPLLVLLAVAGARGMTRDKVLGYLWPDAPAERARHSLEQMLYKLRQTLGDGAFLGADPLRLNHEVVSTDVHEFEQAIDKGDRQRAVMLYRGPFLDGFFASGVPEFERWVESERARLAGRCAAALEGLAAGSAALGDHQAALEWWRRLAALDPLSSRVARGLMEAYVAAGDRASAMRHAAVHAALTREALGAEPDPAVTTLADSLRGASERGFQTDAASGAHGDRVQGGIEQPFAVHAARDAGSPPSDGATPHVRRTRYLVGAAFVVGLALTTAAVTLLWQRSPRPPNESAGGFPRLAVIPFENMGSRDQGYFIDGIADAIRGKLTSIPGLRVTARSSSNQYRSTAKTPQQIAEELGVQYLLMGTVRWVDAAAGTSRVQVTPELIHASTGTAVWEEPFDAALTDVFRVEADIAVRVANALHLALGLDERQRLTERPTENLAAYDAFLRGEEVSQGLAASEAVTLRRALAYYAQATALDSSFTLAWAQLARASARTYNVGMPSPGEALAARHAAERALLLAPGNAIGHIALGEYYSAVQGDVERALQEYTLAHRAAPADADVLSQLSRAEFSVGQFDVALAHLQQAATLDPRSFTTVRRLAQTMHAARRYPEARAAVDRALSLVPTDVGALHLKAMVSLSQGNLRAAREVIEGAPKEVDRATLVAFFATRADLYWVLDDVQQELLLRLPPSAFDGDRVPWGLALAQTYWLRGDVNKARAYADSARLAYEEHVRGTPLDALRAELLGLALAYLGRKAEAIEEAQRALRLNPITKSVGTGSYMQHQLGRVYLLVGDPEKALDQLEPLLELPYHLSPGWLGIDPDFAGLRGNPRFERLVSRGR